MTPYDPATPSVLDHVGSALAALMCLALAGWSIPASTFGAMQRDLGGELPWLTGVTTNPMVALALGVASGVAWFVARRIPNLQRRRIVIAAVFVTASVLLAVCIVGAYLPVFRIAGAVRAE